MDLHVKPGIFSNELFVGGAIVHESRLHQIKGWVLCWFPVNNTPKLAGNWKRETLFEEYYQ